MLGRFVSKVRMSFIFFLYFAFPSHSNILEVYAACAPVEAMDREESSQLKLNEETPNVKLKRSPRRRNSQNNNNQHNDTNSYDIRSHEHGSVPPPPSVSSPKSQASPSSGGERGSGAA